MEGDDNCYNIKHGLKTKTEKKLVFSADAPKRSALYFVAG